MNCIPVKSSPSEVRGSNVQIDVVVYTVHQRKPETIIQIDCERIRILGDGSIDENYAHEGLHLAANRLWQTEADTKSSAMLWMQQHDLKKGNGSTPS